MKKTVRLLVIAAILIICAGYTTMDAKASVSGQKPAGKVTNNTATAEAAPVSAVRAETDTVFNAKSVPKVSAATAQADIIAAAGIMDGEKAKFYIGDVYKSDVRASLKDAAASVNGTVISMLDIDLYALSKEGIRGADTLTAPINIEVVLPRRLKDQTVTMILVKDGVVCEFEDVDANPDTFTLSTQNLGAFAIITK